MHDHEYAIDVSLVRRLIHSQFAAWGAEEITRLDSSGTVHAMFRLGRHLVVRLPRSEAFAPALAREAVVLPALAPRLPLTVPEVVAIGEPTLEYPSPWTILRWIEGVPIDASDEHVDEVAAAEMLGAFVESMRSIDVPGERSLNQRGRSLASEDEWTRRSIEAIADEFDPTALSELWERAREARPWDGEDAWIHGDLLPANLIVHGGELVAVIDFGECARGNPTHDLIAGWWVFGPDGREAFRDASGCDAASWRRARGWALSSAAGALAYYRDMNPAFARQARRTIRNVLAEA